MKKPKYTIGDKFYKLAFNPCDIHPLDWYIERDRISSVSWDEYYKHFIYGFKDFLDLSEPELEKALSEKKLFLRSQLNKKDILDYLNETLNKEREILNITYKTTKERINEFFEEEI